jgi:hypothetical protein
MHRSSSTVFAIRVCTEIEVFSSPHASCDRNLSNDGLVDCATLLRQLLLWHSVATPSLKLQAAMATFFNLGGSSLDFQWLSFYSLSVSTEQA